MNTHKDVSGLAPRDRSTFVHAASLEQWEVSPASSRLGFVLRHLVIQQIPGQFRRWGGKVFLDSSTPIEAEEDGLVVRGRLQLHGITHDLDLHVRSAPAAESNGPNAYSVHGKLDRQLFGLPWNQDLDVGGIVLGDPVDLVGHVELVRAEPAAKIATKAPAERAP